MLEGRSVRFEMEFRGMVKEPNGSTPPTIDVEHFLDAFMQALDERGATDPALGTDLSTGEVELSLIAESENAQAAIADIGIAIRSAIEAAGGLPADWEITWTETHAAAVEELAET